MGKKFRSLSEILMHYMPNTFIRKYLNKNKTHEEMARAKSKLFDKEGNDEKES